MEIQIKTKNTNSEVIEIASAAKVNKDGSSTITLRPGENDEAVLAALKELVEKNTYGGK